MGILSVSDFLEAFKKNALSLTMREIATRDVITVAEDDSLFSASSKISSGNFAILPVVDPHNNKRLVGIISCGDIMIAFNRIGVRLEQ